MISEITPLILTFNEAPNIGRTLSRLGWARRIVVIDSFSTDETCEIVRGFPQTELIQRQFDSFAAQCNFGLQQIQTPWVLSLDADYVLSEELIKEISNCSGGGAPDGYIARFKYCIQGKPLRGSLYPPRTVLYRKDKAQYHNEGHGHRVRILGTTQMLSSFIYHDDRKPLDRWLGEQIKYSAAEAAHLLATPPAQLNRADRLRRGMVAAPVLIFFYTLLGKGLILDGWPGWHYAMQRTFAEILLSLRLLEAKLKPPSPKD